MAGPGQWILQRPCSAARTVVSPAAPRPSRSVRHKENADLREVMEPYTDWCRSLRHATRVTVSATKMAVATSAAAVALPTAALVAPFNPKASAKLAGNCVKMFADSVDGLPPATESIGCGDRQRPSHLPQAGVHIRLYSAAQHRCIDINWTCLWRRMQVRQYHYRECCADFLVA
ncbi:hypothetical protein MTO96_003947 [Rhipicephalus appendiculatus]